MRIATNCLIACLLAMISLDALPETTLLQARLRYVMHLVAVPLGIGQGAWNMFAPNPDQFNVTKVIRFRFADGSGVAYTFPRWEELSPLEFFRLHRLHLYSQRFENSRDAFVVERLHESLLARVRSEFPDKRPIGFEMENQQQRIVLPDAGSAGPKYEYSTLSVLKKDLK